MKKSSSSRHVDARSQGGSFGEMGLDGANTGIKAPGGAPPLLSALSAALGLGAVLCFLAAGLVIASVGASNVWAVGLLVAYLVFGVGAWLGRARAARLGRDSWGRQRLALGTNALFSTVLVGLVLVGLNAIAVRHHTALDLTTNRINTLSPQTQRVLARLDFPVKLTYLYAPRRELGGRPDGAVLTLLEAYRNASSRVETEIVNVVADPLRAREMNPRTPLGQGGASAVLLLERLGSTAPSNALPASRQETAIVDETYVTSGLLRLLDPKPRLFYYLTGHGELDPLAPESPLRLLRAALDAQNVQLQPLALVASGARIPSDAATLLAIAPQTDLGPDELARLQTYLLGRGHFALLLSPPLRPLPRWSTLLQSQGLALGPGLVWDPQQNYRSPATPVGLSGTGARHPILRGTNQSVLFHLSAALKADPGATGLSTLFQSSDAAQCTTARGARQTFITSGPFARGPYVLSAAIERGDSRFWVTASAFFATDQFNQAFGDGAFAQAGLNWTAGDAALVSIPPRAAVTNVLNAPTPALRFIQLFSLFTLPFFILSAGFIVWWRRR